MRKSNQIKILRHSPKKLGNFSRLKDGTCQLIEILDGIGKL